MILNTPSLLRDVPGTQLAVFCWHSDHVIVNNRHFCDISLNQDKQAFLGEDSFWIDKLFSMPIERSMWYRFIIERNSVIVSHNSDHEQQTLQDDRTCPSLPFGGRGWAIGLGARLHRVVRWTLRRTGPCVCLLQPGLHVSVCGMQKKQHSTGAQGLRLNRTPYAASIPMWPFSRRADIGQHWAQQVTLLPTLQTVWGLVFKSYWLVQFKHYNK